MLKGGQKKLDANKDGKISGDDFAMLRGKKQPKEMKQGGMNKMSKEKKLDKQAATAIAMKKAGKKPIKAQTGKMITEASDPMAEGAAMGAIGEAIAPDMISEVDTAMAERAARRKPLPALEEYKRKPITPKERREKDIAKRAQKKMGGGMMQDSMGYKKGGVVRGGRKEIKGLRPAKMF